MALLNHGLLRVEVTSDLVGRAVAERCGDSFAATICAQVPIEGGNEKTV